MRSRPTIAALLVGVSLLAAACSATTPPVSAESTPEIAHTPPVPPRATPTVSQPPASLSEGQRATLDTTFGRSYGEAGPLGTYCPMDTAGRTYYADLVARQLDGYTSEIVLMYLAEACASLPG